LVATGIDDGQRFLRRLGRQFVQKRDVKLRLICALRRDERVLRKNPVEFRRRSQYSGGL
jgi:hypothetical protein